MNQDASQEGAGAGRERLATMASAAERILSEAVGKGVRLGPPERLGGMRDRSTVARCAVLDGPSAAPASVVVKCFRGEGDPGDEPYWTTERRLGNEWAGYELLGDLALDPPLAPRLYGGDAAPALLVIEDLGDGPSLIDVLRGADPRLAEAAFLAYAAGLGRLHAATAGQAAAHGRHRAAHGVTPTTHDPLTANWLGDDVLRFWAGCGALGLTVTAALDAEIAAVAATFRAPGAWGAFDAGDVCPDNHRLIDGGIRFFDFEFGGFRHALLSGCYARVPFPTCWGVNRVPADLLMRVEAAYRGELIRGCPAAVDDAAFGRALVHACAYWLVVTLGWHLATSLDQDDTWGMATLRQRHPLRLASFAAASERFACLPALGDLARTVLARLRDRWDTVSEMPLYPAFRDGAGL